MYSAAKTPKTASPEAAQMQAEEMSMAQAAGEPLAIAVKQSRIVAPAETPKATNAENIAIVHIGRVH